ncbi:putative bifunctional diguanylate cyclase/phosphodiesterase [Sphingomonas hylomeconis]|uniref:Bifunctional diguanylate cyclase/phosphodiesterase n=1 Tax=Sphingomonas hylomeconis TaxID=1395958 RepID=A0ABV7SQ71_9SPHN|nr:EAL domain-containing protein [Sphingomonas hylomeconis]
MFRIRREDPFSLHAAQEQAEDAARAVRLVQALEKSGAGWFWETDSQGCLTYLSYEIEQILHGASAQNRGLTDVFKMDGQGGGIGRTLSFHLSTKTGFADLAVETRHDPSVRWWSISGSPRFDKQDQFIGFVGYGSDLTEKRRVDADINRLAYSDALTGLANRQRMQTVLTQTLSSTRSGFDPVALLLLDLDRFKSVNDTLGHQAGDELLGQVAKRLMQAMGNVGLVGRLGGDEFQIIMSGGEVRSVAEHFATNIIDIVSKPYLIDNLPVTIGCSIGIAYSPEHGTHSESLTRNADLALYRAKGDGRGVHRVFTAEMLAGARTRKQLEDDLRVALTNDELHLAYQPVVSVGSGRIVGCEALLRWRHPQLGQISPADFIPVAEDCGLIEALGEWVLRTAIHNATMLPGNIRVAVNVSPIQFGNPGFAAIVANALANHDIAPDRIELEITEGVFLRDTDSSDKMFKALKGLGVRLALDDFGTGYSALGYLKTAPFDKIKIDKSFVRGAINKGNRNAAIIQSIVMLADALGMETTAEGVEQQDEIELIRELGCTHIQGFVYGLPMPLNDFVEQLTAQGEAAPPVGYKISRAPRNKVIRNAKLVLGDRTYNVAIRNISAEGMMIEGPAFAGESVGLMVHIETPERARLPAIIRWVRDGKTGLQAISKPMNA